jgi:hypothetical protein
MLKKIIFYLPLGGLQQQQLAIAAAADTLAAAAASNRKAYIWKMPARVTSSIAEMPRYTGKSNSNKQ